MNLSRCLSCVLFTAALATSAFQPARAAQEAALSQAAKDAGDAYLRALQAAGQAYAGRDFDKALEKLELADQIHPNIPDTWNMRGAIYAEQHANEKAEDAFEKAAKLNPRDFWAPYNQAQLLLMEKKFPESAAAFQKLLVYNGHEELVQFKVVFADLLAGKNDDAKPILDAMKFPSDTPAYYFAHAAWGFANKDTKDASYWTRAGLKVFELIRCIPFYDALAGAGWVAPRDPKDGTIPGQVFSDSDVNPAASGNTNAVPFSTP